MKWQILVLMLFLIACGKPAVEQTESTTVVEEVKQAPAKEAEAVDISMAMKLGKPMKCVSVQEGQTATIYMKGSQMRMDTMPADAHGIYTADTMYTWKDKQGMMMKMEDIKQMAEQSPYKQPSQEDVVANAQKYNTKCETAIVDESMFTPPADVKFQDMGELLKQTEAAMKGLPK